MARFVKEHKWLVITSLIAIVIIVVSLVITMNLKMKNEEIKETNEQELTKALEDLGRKFYEEFYYINSGKDNKARIAFMKKFSTTGIKTNLDNLTKIVDDETEKVSQFKNNETNEECNKDETLIKIIPKEPYGVKDYEIEVTLVCGF